MKPRWMLFSKKTGKLEDWTAFPSKEKADNYRLLSCDIWLADPYYTDGTITSTGRRLALQEIKHTLRMRDEVVAKKIKMEIVGEQTSC